MKLIVLRHGESLWNHANKFCGWIDVKLSEKGRQEAKRAGELIKSEKHLNITNMYTSKLTRSIQTGNIILEELDTLYIDQYKYWQLNERHYGLFQGVDRRVIFDQVGEQDYNYIRRDFNGKPPPIVGEDESIDKRYDTSMSLPNGESLKEVMDRFIPVLQKIIADHRESEDILIITHGSIVRSIIKWINNIDDKDISKIEIPTGIPIIFELDEPGQLTKPYYYLDERLAQENIRKYEQKTTYKI